MDLRSDPAAAAPTGEPPVLACFVEPERDWLRVRVAGEIDFATAPQLQACLDDLRTSGAERVVLDLSAVTFLDSSGVHLVVGWTTRAEADGHVVAVIPGPPGTHRAFVVTGVERIVPFVARGRAGRFRRSGT